MDFSVLMTVYDKERPEFFDRSLESVLVKQTIRPSQFVLVCDGPLNDSLKKVIDKYAEVSQSEFTVVRLGENIGQGGASKIGVNYCKYELIARMDSDDVSYEYRFEEQLKVFQKMDVDVVGGNISEFVGSEKNITGVRVAKENHDEIVKDFHRRNPINNVTVMFKKASLLDIGNYSEGRVNEDFNLYVRFLLGGKKFYNIQRSLVNVRVGTDMLKRRGDINIFRAWKKNQRLLYEGKVISWFEYAANCIKCYVFVRCPSFIKSFFYKHLLRKHD